MALSQKGSTKSARVSEASKRRREEEKRSLRESILRAAAELFEKNPTGDFSLRQVAEHIGYTATTIYLYFKDKDELLFAICEEGFTVFDQALQAAYQSATSPLEKINAMGRAYIAFGLSHPAHYRVMFQERREFLLSPKKGEEASKLSSLLLLQKAVQEAIDAGETSATNAPNTADILWAAVHSVVDFGISNPLFDKERVQTLFDGMLSFLQRGLRKNPSDTESL